MLATGCLYLTAQKKRGIDMKFKVYCKYEDYSRILNFYIFSIAGNGEESFCKNIDTMEFEEYSPGDILNKPTFQLTGRMTKPLLQAMANELKELGIKADEEPILENELSAVKYHLEDMRKITFKQLEGEG